MDEIHVIILTIGLFVLTFINPGANLLVVVQTSLSSGKNAGLLTGLGVALGDAIYSGLGLFGMAALIAEGELCSRQLRSAAVCIWFGMPTIWCAIVKSCTWAWVLSLLHQLRLGMCSSAVGC